ncbi:MAG: hypothetical protein ACREOZ_01905, partial [Gloeomargaritales cyanobacterium]
PLTYVIKSDENAGDAEEDERIRNAPLHGASYNADNFRTYHVLKGFLIKGTAFVHIQDIEPNGRAAWQALMDFYQGDKAQIAMRASADAVIKETKFNGEKRNFRFEDYTSKFIQAFQTKKDFGEVVDGNEQVRAFIAGINHPGTKSIALNLLNFEEFKTNLSKTAAQVADLARVDGILTDQKVEDNRKIGASFSQSEDNRNKKGGGRGKGRGNRKGHGKKNAKGSNHYDKPFIPKSSFANLSSQEKAWLIQGRDMACRSVAAAKSMPSDDDDDNDDDEQKESSASSQFGRQGRDRSLQNTKKQRKQKIFASSARRVASTISVRTDTPADYTLRARMECD